MEAALDKAFLMQNSDAPTGTCELTYRTEKVRREGITFRACRAASRSFITAQAVWRSNTEEKKRSRPALSFDV